MALPNKYKGKTFADVAKDIQSTYKERYDPISMRGMRKSFESLKEAQEGVKAQQQAEQPQEQSQGQMQAPQVQPVQGGQGNVNLPQAESATPFNRAASKSYNEKFAYGGKMTNDYFDGGVQNDKNDPTQMDYSGLVGTEDVQKVKSKGYSPFTTNSGSDILDRSMGLPTEEEGGDNNFNMGALGLGLQAAPLIGNIAQLATLQRPDQEQARTINTSNLTSALDSFKPRQQSFENVDMDQIERGITEASGRFTQNNVNASRGNAGSFVANELANQNNLYRNIGQARMQGQMQDLKVDQLNAQENARVDAINATMAQQKAGITAKGDMFNAQMEYRNDVANAQNDAAYESRKAELWGGVAGSVANIGNSMMNMGRAGKATGYGFLGEYLQGQNKKANGGMMNGDPEKEPTGTMLDAIDEQIEYPDEEILFNKAKQYEDLVAIRDKYATVLGDKKDSSLKYMDKAIKNQEKALTDMQKDKEKYVTTNSLKNIFNIRAKGGVMKKGKK